MFIGRTGVNVEVDASVEHQTVSVVISERGKADLIDPRGHLDDFQFPVAGGCRARLLGVIDTVCGLLDCCIEFCGRKLQKWITAA